MNEGAPILIAYDGSDDAKRAVDEAAALFSGSAVVVTAWQPFVAVLAEHPMSASAPPPSDVAEIDRRLEEGAEKTAAEGAERANAAGLDARAQAVEAAGPVWDAILRSAEDSDARVVVIGPRGLSGLKSALLGSVSHAVMQHARRPVLVAQPSGER